MNYRHAALDQRGWAMSEIGAGERGRDNITRFFQLQGRFAGSAVLEDAPKHHAVTGMGVALGHTRNAFLAFERRGDEFWDTLDAVAQWFTTGQVRGQQREYSAGGGLGLGGGDTALRPSMVK